jgi:hypothetical protein
MLTGWEGGVDRKDDSKIGVGIFQSNLYDSTPELEFLDINLTKDRVFCAMLFTGPSTGGCFKNPYKKTAKQKKIESIGQ